MQNVKISSFNKDFKKICIDEEDNILFYDSIKNESITYGEIWKIICRYNFFFNKKYNKNDYVISCIDNSSKTINLFLCFSTFGYNYLPLGSDTTKEEFVRYIGSYKPKHVIVSNSTNVSLINYLNKSKIRIIDIDKINLKSKNISLKSLNNKSKLILNTSGTSGEPKKIVLDINRLWSSGKAFIKHYKFLNNDMTIVNYLPMNYLGGLFNLCLIPIACRSKIVLTEKFSGKLFFNIWNIVEKYNVNVLWLVPSILKGLIKLKELYFNHSKFHEINLKGCLIGTAPLEARLKLKFEKIFKTKVFENYGTSETTFISAETEKYKSYNKNEIGKILQNIKYKDSVNLKLSMKVKTPYDFDGYIDQLSDIPKKEVYFDTGDICKVSKKKIVKIVGRTKEIIKKGGNLISLKEMTSLMETHPLVSECSFKIIKHQFYGEDFNLIYTSNSKKKIEGIEEWFKNKVSQLKFPNKIIFTKKFNKTISGKIKI